MADRPAAPWSFECAWCEYSILVFPRGQRGRDEGAGVEAAELMQGHVLHEHAQTWENYLATQRRQAPSPGELGGQPADRPWTRVR